MFLPLGLYGCVVLALLVAELREDRRAQYFFKPLAALGFVILAVMCGAFETTYGQIILAGLVACALGDGFLLSRERPVLFRFGMLAFAGGHTAYGAAFSKSITAGNAVIIYTAICVAGGLGFMLWIWRHLPRDMKIPVLVYAFIIMAMIILAAAMDKMVSPIIVIIPAILFAISDMFVARDRFVTPSPKNALAITPLYFGAQALFALSVQV